MDILIYIIFDIRRKFKLNEKVKIEVKSRIRIVKLCQFNNQILKIVTAQPSQAKPGWVTL